MLIDKPCCDFKKCRNYFDGNCMDKIEYERCSYSRQKSDIERLKGDLEFREKQLHNLAKEMMREE